jgi:hypothetical protein
MTNTRFKPFFVHKNYQDVTGLPAKHRSKPRGFTAYIQPADDPRMVKIQVVFCSSKDQFCKATGREEVLKTPTHTMNTRGVAKQLADYSSQLIWRFSCEEDFEYLFKYMV